MLLRLLGLVYLASFASAATQIVPLLGPEGLLPATSYLDRAVAEAGSRLDAFLRVPSLFLWLPPSEKALLGTCWLGVALAIAVLCGATNALLQLLLWALHLSLIKIGQLFYGYGWEIQLAETGFLAIFLCPLGSVSPRGASPPPVIVIWLFRWLIARIMLGAGLIKLRGDPCWRDLTCLVYHYETQPIPSPLSWIWHHAPRDVHRMGVLFNHLVELVAPFFAFGPQRARWVAGGLFVVFQAALIASGNLSFLNWLTIIPAIACFDDELMKKLLPRKLSLWLSDEMPAEPSRPHRIGAAGLLVVVLGLSVDPVVNLISPRQVMNTSFDALALVNSYGAFGSVGRERYEAILSGRRGSSEEDDASWLAYELPCKPGDIHRRPCFLTPWHLRLDWQIWFAAQSDIERQPWLVHLAYKLLSGDPAVKQLFAVDPFPDSPPRFIRAELYRYEFTRPGEEGWWKRTYVGEYLRPIALEDRTLRSFMRAQGWK
ncbi:lipase maturation factor family protein [Chondromyces crocatus]|uniref:lipase maturation factor family protein n=1 Tax=Chondromyces crocatus TaxID=52 RepID=UPI001FE160D4|nr:lipase maturation factor family protein [Chondromyces crocatus]